MCISDIQITFNLNLYINVNGLDKKPNESINFNTIIWMWLTNVDKKDSLNYITNQMALKCLILKNNFTYNFGYFVGHIQQCLG